MIPPTKEHFSINFKTAATLALLLCWSGKRALPPNCSAVRCSRRHTCSVRCLLISRPRPHLLQLLCWSGKRALPPHYNNRRLTAAAAQLDVASITLATFSVSLLILRPRQHLLRYYFDMERGLSHHTITIVDLLRQHSVGLSINLKTMGYYIDLERELFHHTITIVDLLRLQRNPM